MTAHTQRVLDALWDEAPMSIQDLTGYFNKRGQPMDHAVLRYTIRHLLLSGRIAVHSRSERHPQAFLYAPTGKPECELDTETIIRLVIDQFAPGCSFDQGQVAVALEITHEAARAAINEMRRTGLAVKTYARGGHDPKQRLSRYTLDPRKAAIF